MVYSLDKIRILKNWNENRIQKSEMSKIYISILDKLEYDNQKLEQISPNFEWKIKVI